MIINGYFHCKYTNWEDTQHEVKHTTRQLVDGSYTVQVNSVHDVHPAASCLAAPGHQRLLSEQCMFYISTV